ncbi:hypothetical protein BOX15_Mlig032689g1 [Macrostomum lignano]|uniref:Fibronectin type-III domain-containing protein n=1 Tax=Macrostomum lignano TaxID=282301 RepID=A0A267G5T0_9PLAT|nr:hypothetical protein BOX15_Mlig032689g1 [Macrostomum lignano]
MATDVANQSLSIPYIGGPASLGTLYDAQTGKYLTGPKLWSRKTTDEMTVTRPNVSQAISIESQSSFSDRAKKLEMSADLKLSFLCGSAEVEGSGKYLTEKLTRVNSESLVFAYKTLTEFKELHLGPEVEYPQFLDDESATHVVTGIQYGGRAFLVFEREKQESESKTGISGSFRGQVSKLKSLFEVSGQLQAEHSKNDATETESIRCRYYGDFKLEPPPLTLREAFGCVQSFKSENAGSPVQVYLTPLSKIGGKDQKLMRGISEECLNEAGNYCQLLDDIINAADDKIKELEDTPWRMQCEVLATFRDRVQAYRTRFRDQLMSILPRARQTGDVSREISELISRQKDECGASPQQLLMWLRNRERECMALQHSARVLSDNGARVLNEREKDELFVANRSDYKLLFEVQAPRSHFPQYLPQPTCAEEVGKTWIESEDYRSYRRDLDRAVRFLQQNRGSAAVAVIEGSPHDQQTVKLQIKCYKDFAWTETELPKPPTELQCSEVDENTAKFSWKAEPNASNGYVVYVLRQREADLLPYHRESTETNSITVSSLYAGTPHKAYVTAVTELGESEPSEQISFTTEPALNCSEFVLQNFCEDNPTPAQKRETFAGNIFQLRVRQIPSPECKCSQSCICPNSFEVGNRNAGGGPPKFLLLIGETGAGKSTLINGIANAFYRVQFDDNFRLKLVGQLESRHKSAAASQAHSQTAGVSVYTLFPVDTGGTEDSHRSAMDCPLTIIDTPGFGDTRGPAQDKINIKKIAKMLGEDGQYIPGMTGVLHGIGFVVKASQNRLNATQRYIFDQVLSLFGKDVKPIIYPLFTFADSEEPEALDALDEDKVPYKTYLSFNNAALYANNTESEGPEASRGESKSSQFHLKAPQWKKCNYNYQQLFEKLESSHDGVSLLSTRETLKSRRSMEVCAEKLKLSVQSDLQKLTNLAEYVKLVGSCGKFFFSSDFSKTCEVRSLEVREVKLPHDQFATNCMACRRTCHDKCSQKDSALCSVMDSSGCCIVCPKNCVLSEHRNSEYRFEEYEVAKTVTVEEIAKEYGVVMHVVPIVKMHEIKIAKLFAKQFCKTEGLLLKIKADIDATFDELSYNIVTIHKCLQSLEQMALRQYPLSVREYVDHLIEMEDTQKRPGWENRTKLLQEAKKSAEIIAAARDGQDPFESNKERILKQCEKALRVIRIRDLFGYYLCFCLEFLSYKHYKAASRKSAG